MRRSRTFLQLSSKFLNGQQRITAGTKHSARPQQTVTTSFFSTAATAPSTTTSSSNTEAASSARTNASSSSKRKIKDPITITPSAAERLQTLLSSPNGQNAIGIRLGVKRRGCNGLSYTMNYAQEVNPKDTKMEAHGVVVYIEPMALFNVVGTVMDWEETDLSSEFTFENPNSKGECGCGESFNV